MEFNPPSFGGAPSWGGSRGRGRGRGRERGRGRGRGRARGGHFFGDSTLQSGPITALDPFASDDGFENSATGFNVPSNPQLNSDPSAFGHRKPFGQPTSFGSAPSRKTPIQVLDPFAPDPFAQDSAQNEQSFGQSQAERPSAADIFHDSDKRPQADLSASPFHAPPAQAEPPASVYPHPSAAEVFYDLRKHPLAEPSVSPFQARPDDDEGATAHQDRIVSPTTEAHRLDEEREYLKRKIHEIERSKNESKKQKLAKEAKRIKDQERKDALKRKALESKKGTEPSKKQGDSQTNVGNNTPKPHSMKKTRDSMHAPLARAPKAPASKTRMSIKDAVNMVGTCPTMCPGEEMTAREQQRDLSIFERQPGDDYVVDPSKAVKKYRRSAALSEQPPPEEIRPSPVLARTMDYLKNLCDTSTEPFHIVHNFIRDRTRSIRQDFTFQGTRDDTYVRILEECVRFHIMSEHKLWGVSVEMFSSKQNLEQLDKCLITLRQIYDERRKASEHTSENEAEMQSYYLLLHLFHSKTRVQVYSSLSSDVFHSYEVQFALRVSKAVCSRFMNYAGFFRLVEEAPYLQACLLHPYFGKVRTHAANVLKRAYSPSTYHENLPISNIKQWLGFDSHEEIVSFCEQFRWKIAEDEVILRKKEKEKEKEKGEEAEEEFYVEYTNWDRADRLIESKVDGLSYSEIMGFRQKGSELEPSDIPASDVPASDVLASNIPASDIPPQQSKIAGSNPVPTLSTEATATPPKTPSRNRQAESVLFGNPAAFGNGSASIDEIDECARKRRSPISSAPSFSFPGNIAQVDNTKKSNSPSLGLPQARLFEGSRKRQAESYDFANPAAFDNRSVANDQIDDPARKRRLPSNLFAGITSPDDTKKSSSEQPAVPKPLPTFDFGPPMFSKSPSNPDGDGLNKTKPQTHHNNVPVSNSELLPLTSSAPVPVGIPASAPAFPLAGASFPLVATSAPALPLTTASAENNANGRPTAEEQDPVLKKEKEDDKIAFDLLIELEKEFKRIACQPDGSLDFVEKQIEELTENWKQDLSASQAKVLQLSEMIEKISIGLNELKTKTSKAKPVYADTEEKQDWIFADCDDDLEFAEQLWRKVRHLRRSITIALLRTGGLIRPPPSRRATWGEPSFLST